MPEAVDPVSTDDKNITKPPTHIAAYAADVDSLKSLELSAERDEINWFSKIKAIQIAEVDGADATAITYEETDDMDLGELIFEEYKTDVDVQSLTAINSKLGAPLKGKAFVNSKEVKVLVFRDK